MYKKKPHIEVFRRTIAAGMKELLIGPAARRSNLECLQLNVLARGGCCGWFPTFMLKYEAGCS